MAESMKQLASQLRRALTHMDRTKAIRLAVLALLLVAVGISLLVLPVQDYLVGLLDGVQRMGTWGLVILAAAYTPVCILLLPGSILTLGAGFAFGVVRGTIAVSIGSTIGATAAFRVGRTLARRWVEKKVAGNGRFRAIDEAVAERGFLIVLLMRLSPAFPFNLSNYAFALTKISLRQYVLASWLGMLPGTIMYVYLGSAVKSLADLAAGRVERSTGQQVFFFVGLFIAVAVTVLVTRIAQQALRRARPAGRASSA